MKTAAYLFEQKCEGHWITCVDRFEPEQNEDRRDVFELVLRSDAEQLECTLKLARGALTRYVGENEALEKQVHALKAERDGLATALKDAHAGANESINLALSMGQTERAASERYTCKGKGGSYELIGRASAAGVLHDILVSNDYPVYRDTESGLLFVRVGPDFDERMELIPAAPVCTPVQAAPDADENAPWLTLAHMICADAGVPCGHITDRLKALRDILAAAVQAAPVGMSVEHAAQLERTIKDQARAQANETPEIKRLREAMEAAEVKANQRPYGTRGWKALERAYGEAIEAYGKAVKDRDWRPVDDRLSMLPPMAVGALSDDYNETAPAVQAAPVEKDKARDFLNQIAVFWNADMLSASGPAEARFNKLMEHAELFLLRSRAPEVKQDASALPPLPEAEVYALPEKGTGDIAAFLAGATAYSADQMHQHAMDCVITRTADVQKVLREVGAPTTYEDGRRMH
ncbi:MAG TPA: hypothetical protein VF681_13280, partial [Abditibacteriaceae bacterium]